MGRGLFWLVLLYGLDKLRAVELGAVFDAEVASEFLGFGCWFFGICDALVKGVVVD